MIAFYSAASDSREKHARLEAELGEAVLALHPRFIRSAEDCPEADRVYIDGDWPMVRATYESRGSEIVEMIAEVTFDELNRGAEAFRNHMATAEQAAPVDPIVETRHRGGRYWDVYVDGVQVNEHALNKEDAHNLAQAIAEEGHV